MPHLINITVELDTEYESEARRVGHKLADDLTNYFEIRAVCIEPPFAGELSDD